MSGRERFKHYIQKVGSGEHTSRGLSRDEAHDALALMLRDEATPAQIGAFLIAHRIRRPEPQELAGMLDLYRELGPSLSSTEPAVCFGMPFDGRTRTAPLYPLTALTLAAAGLPVVLQGGARMPVKYGVTAMELFASLGLNLQGLSLAALQQGLDSQRLALVHLPDHFPLADRLTPIRDELGKRPPVASLELLWTAHRSHHLLVSGFVHPPTETRAWKALELAGESAVITVKGLEGSTDLPISRACITARVHRGVGERVILHPRDHGCYGADALWIDLDSWREQALAALGGQGPLAIPLAWNAGTYLWFAGIGKSLEEGLAKAQELVQTGAVLGQLRELIAWRTLAG
ncbi:anthranilate phosphoribosyltransferase family protein [Cyanobium sp. NIES-981]|uniref:anthranilate phosphoribosyltransferase family protein n=1 Tax=Cyanobium sp. NIES-981 TaxID=1851505 RepID=UPI001CED813E|nr:anthranilate phosphoribosyltransferase family protein [Cyanobium sp. NIES-981]